MNKKVLLILADGMRPDSLAACGHPLIEKMKQQSSYTLNATTVMPSVTLPCHMSLFHSVDPIRHNTTTNDYAPQVRPIGGLFEQVKKYEGKTATVFDWEQLRDLSRPGNLNFSLYVGADNEEGLYKTLRKTLKTVCEYIPEEKPDFMFFYIGVPDEDRTRVFDRFFTADRAHTSGKGTGLGLSICQRIMEMHGRSIRLLETDAGAAFAFDLEADRN